jgi:hypothetical protein
MGYLTEHHVLGPGSALGVGTGQRGRLEYLSQVEPFQLLEVISHHTHTTDVLPQLAEPSRKAYRLSLISEHAC